MKKTAILILFILLIFGNSCSYKPEGSVKIYIKGSDTMLPLVRKLAEEYMKANPGVSIYVEGGGSGLGVKALSRGEADICTASRLLTAEEKKIIAEKFRAIGVSTLIAKDALSIYLNPGNKIVDLKVSDLSGIFEGKIKNWNKLGGDDLKIIPVIRNPNSGTYLYFKEHILGDGNYTDSAVVKNTTSEIIGYVLQNKGAVGYGGIGYNEGQTLAKIENVYPSERNVINGTYPVVRYLYFYTINNPHENIKKFIDWTISSEGQQLIKETGYFPIWEKAY